MIVVKFYKNCIIMNTKTSGWTVVWPVGTWHITLHSWLRCSQTDNWQMSCFHNEQTYSNLNAGILG